MEIEISKCLMTHYFLNSSRRLSKHYRSIKTILLGMIISKCQYQRAITVIRMHRNVIMIPFMCLWIRLAQIKVAERSKNNLFNNLKHQIFWISKILSSYQSLFLVALIFKDHWLNWLYLQLKFHPYYPLPLKSRRLIF